MGEGQRQAAGHVRHVGEAIGQFRTYGRFHIGGDGGQNVVKQVF